MAHAEVKLRSSEGAVFTVDSGITHVSGFLAKVLEDDAQTVPDELPLSTISTKTLSQVLEYCAEYREKPGQNVEQAPSKKKKKKRKVDESALETVPSVVSKIAPGELCHVLLAADFLDIQPLLDDTVARLASLIMAAKGDKYVYVPRSWSASISIQEELPYIREWLGKRPGWSMLLWHAARQLDSEAEEDSSETTYVHDESGQHQREFPEEKVPEGLDMSTSWSKHERSLVEGSLTLREHAKWPKGMIRWMCRNLVPRSDWDTFSASSAGTPQANRESALQKVLIETCGMCFDPRLSKQLSDLHWPLLRSIEANLPASVVDMQHEALLIARLLGLDALSEELSPLPKSSAEAWLAGASRDKLRIHALQSTRWGTRSDFTDMWALEFHSDGTCTYCQFYAYKHWGLPYGRVLRGRPAVKPNGTFALEGASRLWRYERAGPCVEAEAANIQRSLFRYEHEVSFSCSLLLRWMDTPTPQKHFMGALDREMMESIQEHHRTSLQEFFHGSLSSE